MENVIADRVKNTRLTKSQRKIAEFFVQHPERVGMSSSMEMARAIGVSDASITRFARAIGYEGFTDLKNDIYSSLASQAAGGINNLSLAERFEANRTQFGGDSPAEYIGVIQYNLERTFRQNGEQQFQEAADLLRNAEHRYIIGFRGCLGVASQCAWLLRFLLDHVIHICDEGPGGIGSLQDIQPGDCALLFSMNRFYKTDLRLARLARDRGASVILVTNSVLSPLAELAHILLIAESKNVSFFNSSMALNLISEYLVTRLAQLLPEDYRRRASERDELTEELRL